MKIHMVKISCLCLAVVLALGGCVSRDQADEKLGKACQAGINAYLGTGQQIDTIKNIRATASPVGRGYRHVSIDTVMVDGWLEMEETYECIFDEKFSFMNLGYTAAIYQLRVGDIIVGQSGDKVMGSAQDFIRITDAVRDALYR